MLRVQQKALIGTCHRLHCVITMANGTEAISPVSSTVRIDQIRLASIYASPLLAALGLSRPECMRGEYPVPAMLQHRRFVATLQVP